MKRLLIVLFLLSGCRTVLIEASSSPHEHVGGQHVGEVSGSNHVVVTGRNVTIVTGRKNGLCHVVYNRTRYVVRILDHERHCRIETNAGGELYINGRHISDYARKQPSKVSAPPLAPKPTKTNPPPTQGLQPDGTLLACVKGPGDDIDYDEVRMILNSMVLKHKCATKVSKNGVHQSTSGNVSGLNPMPVHDKAPYFCARVDPKKVTVRCDTSSSAKQIRVKAELKRSSRSTSDGRTRQTETFTVKRVKVDPSMAVKPGASKTARIKAECANTRRKLQVDYNQLTAKIAKVYNNAVAKAHKNKVGSSLEFELHSARTDRDYDLHAAKMNFDYALKELEMDCEWRLQGGD